MNNTRPLWGVATAFNATIARHRWTLPWLYKYTYTYGPLKGPIWSYEVEAVDAVLALTIVV